MSENGSAPKQYAAPRVRGLLGLNADATWTAHESAQFRKGPPDEIDRRAIAALIEADRASRGPLPGQRDGVAEATATSLLSLARETVARLNDGSFDTLSNANLAALEAVLSTRGRPALNVEGNRLESIDLTKHPGSGFWRTFVEEKEPNLIRAAGATGALVVRDRSSTLGTWVAGTAWLIKPDLAMTNRHVLFPDEPGIALAERIPGAKTSARIATGVEVLIDFAFDSGTAREKKYAGVDVPFVSAENDPIDAALIRVNPIGAAFAQPLVLAATTPSSKYMYVVGHPGRVAAAELTQDIQAVFGNPDGRKRVSLGELMPSGGAFPNDILHDASTIGGYSGACVLCFDRCEVAGLHYHGTFLDGNRAIPAEALRRHDLARFF
ncbi:serine protease [Bradyrhizobium sp. AUGA SZCCT0160]|uniref:trypsin-like serine peptidase n=1 Tax=Bradyrhizobium sp. AUGA SZCCT0160 TaxID=2807662 RepID=UPI001BA5A51F|nr:trypsin-like peptidase domain-containing protein [Bradyrhizobium sp. AUGA SZCCT0160]MBR1188556.1 trypsin-like peptidase domain-containing protein [Bradyrhizobium sp. AUGA SZCCT0160]